MECRDVCVIEKRHWSMDTAAGRRRTGGSETVFSSSALPRTSSDSALVSWASSPLTTGPSPDTRLEDVPAPRPPPPHREHKLLLRRSLWHGAKKIPSQTLSQQLSLTRYLRRRQQVIVTCPKTLFLCPKVSTKQALAFSYCSTPSQQHDEKDKSRRI